MCVSFCMCVCYHLISETTIFQYPDKLSMDGMGWEKPELKRFVHLKIWQF